MQTSQIKQHAEQKEFVTMRAQVAIRGYVLHRSEATDGPVVFFAERNGQLHYQPTVAALRAFVRQIMGKP
jgi:hypothetical protein